MWHLASLYFPYDKLFKSIYTEVKIVFKSWPIQNIPKKKKDKFCLTQSGDAVEGTFHFLCSSWVSFISSMYLKWSSKKMCSSQKNLSLKNFKSEKALSMAQRNTGSWLLSYLGNNTVFVIPIGKKKLSLPYALKCSHFRTGRIFFMLPNLLRGCIAH